MFYVNVKQKNRQFQNNINFAADKKQYSDIAKNSKIGEMAERSNAAVLKTVVLHPRNRGFESLFLRNA